MTTPITCHIEVGDIPITVDSTGIHPSTGYELFLWGELERLRASLAAECEVNMQHQAEIAHHMTEVARLRAAYENACAQRAAMSVERDALRRVLDGFSGPPPTLLQWKMICDRAKDVAAAIDAARREA